MRPNYSCWHPLGIACHHFLAPEHDTTDHTRMCPGIADTTHSSSGAVQKSIVKAFLATSATSRSLRSHYLLTRICTTYTYIYQRHVPRYRNVTTPQPCFVVYKFLFHSRQVKFAPRFRNIIALKVTMFLYVARCLWHTVLAQSDFFLFCLYTTSLCCNIYMYVFILSR